MVTMTVFNKSTRAIGSTTFRRYIAAVLCGPSVPETYEAGMLRCGGVEEVPGIIDALLDAGIRDKHEVICAASRVSRCWKSTVANVVDTLSGNDKSVHFWFERGEELNKHEDLTGEGGPNLLITY